MPPYAVVRGRLSRADAHAVGPNTSRSTARTAACSPCSGATTEVAPARADTSWPGAPGRPPAGPVTSGTSGLSKPAGPPADTPALIAVNPPRTGRQSIPPAEASGARFQPRCRKRHCRYDGAAGTSNPRAKLTDDKVRKLQVCRADGLTHRQLAADFGISDVSACAAVNRKTWAHVP
jgi:hypothetical protein